MDTIKPEVYITQEDELWDERIPQKETYSQEVIETGINYVIGLSRKSNEATYNSGQEIQNFFDEFDARQGNQNEINNM